MRTPLPSDPHPTAAQAEVNPWLVLLLALGCGLIVANIYYAQTLVGPIRQALGMAPSAAGLIVTLTQVGYGLGLLFVIPLGDYVENRALVLVTVGLSALSMLGAAASGSAPLFLACALLTGIGSVAVQVLVLYAAHMAHDGIRGRVVGNVMSGLMLGIMLARPLASLVADLASWQAVYRMAALAMLAMLLVLGVALPKRQPHSPVGYRELMASMVGLVRDTPLLRLRAFCHACVFASFSLFWTVVPLHLAQRFAMPQRGIALFALAGVTGAIVAPLAGRMADRGFTRPASITAMLLAAGGLLLAQWEPQAQGTHLALLVAVAIALDAGASGHLVLSQRVIFGLGAAQRGRFNALFMATFFTGGAIGSALGGWAYARGGWSLAAWTGMLFPSLALAAFLLAGRRTPPA